MALEQDLLAIEKQFWTGGPEAYQQHCDDACLVVFASMAAVMSRDDIAGTAEKGRWSDVSLKPLGLVQPTDAVATIAYDCTARRKDGQPHAARVTSSYVRRADGWKLCAHQQAEAGG
jgi:ketosteroid isomerase-like protein